MFCVFMLLYYIDYEYDNYWYVMFVFYFFSDLYNLFMFIEVFDLFEMYVMLGFL